MDKKKTNRGFSLINFIDRYGKECSLQKSSLAFEDCVWFGIDDPDPKIMASRAGAHGLYTKENCGWIPYPVPSEVSLSTRMHLTRKQVFSLLPHLIKFIITGNI